MKERYPNIKIYQLRAVAKEMGPITVRTRFDLFKAAPFSSSLPFIAVIKRLMDGWFKLTKYVCITTRGLNSVKLFMGKGFANQILASWLWLRLKWATSAGAMGDFYNFQKSMNIYIAFAPNFDAVSMKRCKFCLRQKNLLFKYKLVLCSGRSESSNAFLSVRRFCFCRRWDCVKAKRASFCSFS